MQITRVLNLTEEEFSILMSAGELLGNINKALNAEASADDLSSGVKELITALKDVTEKILNKQGE